MDIITLLSPERISCNQEISSKKRTFESLAALLTSTQDQVSEDDVFNALINREKLGCTALGNGVAIPHARINTPYPRAAILSLKDGISLDAPDKKPVHLLIAILMPEETSDDDSMMLKELAETLSKKIFIENICRYKEPSIVIDYFNSFCGREPIAA